MSAPTIANEAAPATVTVVVPCYNEEPAILQTLESVGRAIADLPLAEILVVDDGSTDASAELAGSRAENPAARLRVVRHSRNRGYGAAVKTGIRRATGEIIVIADADGTYPLDQIPRLVTEVVDGADMAVGARSPDRPVEGRIHQATRGLLRLFCSWLVGERIPDMNSGLRAFRRPIAERYFNVLPDGFSLTTTLTVAMMRARYDVRFVPVDYRPRVGRSKLRPVRDTARFVQLVVRTGMYFAPLRILVPPIVLVFAGFLVSLGYDVVILRDLTEKTMLLLLFALTATLFALLADMIDKRS